MTPVGHIDVVWIIIIVVIAYAALPALMLVLYYIEKTFNALLRAFSRLFR